MIIVRSVHDNPELIRSFELTIPQTKSVRFDINYFFFEITPKSKDKLTLRAVLNVDPKMKFIPKWVMNFFVRKIGSYMLGKLIKLAKNIKGTEWEKNMAKEENKEFYQWLDERFKEHFGK